MNENRASVALANAIERCDVDAMRRAIKRGASLTAVPDSSVSPLLHTLFQCDRPGWEACAELLLEYGEPINGRPLDKSPLASCVDVLIPERRTDALKTLKFLLAHGANADANALFRCVVKRQIQFVRLLLKHGADPNRAVCRDGSTIDWLQWRIDWEKSRGGKHSEYAKMLEILTGQS